MYRSIILPEAKKDISEAAHWYNHQRKGLGKEFTKVLRSKVKLIENNPLGYSVKFNHNRATIINRFPFMIHFKIEELSKIILITAVLHTSRNPNILNKE